MRMQAMQLQQLLLAVVLCLLLFGIALHVNQWLLANQPMLLFALMNAFLDVVHLMVTCHVKADVAAPVDWYFFVSKPCCSHSKHPP